MATVRDTDLPDLLISLGYQVKRIGRYYTTQEMDSIRIKDRRTWFRYSEGIGGDAITFLQRFYKITYRVNGSEYRTLADNLSTSKNYTLAASATALGLASNERVTEVMFVFGQAPAGFAQVEKPYLHCTAVANLASTSFVNVADVGGVYNGQWVQAVSRWVTTVYGKPVIPTLPRTGY